MPAQPAQLRIGAVLHAGVSEWRLGATLAPRISEGWQLVYVLDGVVEELTDGRSQHLRRGRLLLHQPAETCSMQAVGHIPPEVLRVEFEADGDLLDTFRSRLIVASPEERNALRLLTEAVREGWQSIEDGVRLPDPLRRPDAPLGADRLQQLYIEQVLWLAARRLRHEGRKLSPRAQAEQRQNDLVQGARLYLAQHMEQDPTLAEVCRAVGCSRTVLQQAFAERTGYTLREYFSRMKAERAAGLLAQGYSPGEVAQRMGYSSAAYFSQRFRALTGQTPTAYRRNPKPLHLCNK